MRRPTFQNTEWDAARHEVCMHRFVDIGSADLGLAIVTDCKYGVSVKESTVGLTLLKAGKFPYEKTDIGKHEFTYSMMVRNECLSTGEVHALADLLNKPVLAIDAEASLKLLNV
jgi:alpha-mannosidase